MMSYIIQSSFQYSYKHHHLLSCFFGYAVTVLFCSVTLQFQKMSNCVGLPMSNIIPVKNYSHELDLDLNCDILLLTAVQQMLRYADNYFDDIHPM